MLKAHYFPTIWLNFTIIYALEVNYNYHIRIVTGYHISSQLHNRLFSVGSLKLAIYPLVGYLYHRNQQVL